MILKDFLSIYCSLIDNIINIVDQNDNNILTVEAINLSRNNMAVYDEETGVYTTLSKEVQNSIINTWGAYTSNNRTIVKIYIRVED